jgi:hypothetical protein
VARGYAAFLQNAGLFFRADSQGWHPGLVCDAPSEQRIGNVVFDKLQRSSVDTLGSTALVGGRTRDRKRYRSLCPNGVASSQCDALPWRGERRQRTWVWRASHPPNGTRCPRRRHGPQLLRWTRLKADENVAGGECDHEDEGGGPPHPIHG